MTRDGEDTARMYRKLLDAESKLGEMGNLIAALTVLADRFADLSADGEVALLRDGVIGIARALERQSSL